MSYFYILYLYPTALYYGDILRLSPTAIRLRQRVYGNACVPTRIRIRVSGYRCRLRRYGVGGTERAYERAYGGSERAYGATTDGATAVPGLTLYVAPASGAPYYKQEV
eukprot:2368565-Rhodomonas_salina.1